MNVGMVLETISRALAGGHHSRKGGGQFFPAVAMSTNLAAQLPGHDTDGESDQAAQERGVLPHAMPDAHQPREGDHHMPVGDPRQDVTGGEPLMTAGNTSLVHEMVERAGGRNLYGDLSETYPTISLEDLVHRDPDILVLTTMAPADLARRAGWDRLSAVKKGQVHRMDPDLLVRPTLRSLEGLRQMVTLFEAWQP